MENSSSPPLNVGDRVALRELQPACLNGEKGTIVEDYEDGRYKVRLEKAKISIPLDKENVSFVPSPPVQNWCCDYCPAKFPTYDEAASHQSSCLQRGVNNKQSEAQRAKKLKREEEGRLLRQSTSKCRTDMFTLFEITTHIQNVAETCMTYATCLEKTNQGKRKDNFPYMGYKNRMKSKFEDTIPSIVVGIRTLSKSFHTFANDALSHHPYHQHESILLKCAEELEQIACECRPLYSAIPDSSMWVPAAATIFAQHTLQSTIPALNGITKTIQGLITFPERNEASGPFYSKRHAIKAAIKFPKGSHARGDVIQDMIHMGVVPSRASLYRAINDVEVERNAIIDSKWVLGKKAKEVMHHKNISMWEKNIYLPLIPVDCDEKGEPILDNKTLERLFGPPAVVSVNAYNRMKKSITLWGARLYFSPKQFPTPANLQDAGKASDKTFKKLKKYMLKWFEDAKSPIICNGGKPGSKKFVCSMKRKAKKASTMGFGPSTWKFSDCNFSVTVKWDRIGYYIPMYNHKQNCYVCQVCHTHPLYVPSFAK